MKQENVSDKMRRRWFVTINNEEMPDDEFMEYCKGLEHVKYFAFQREKGHEKETEHIHLFVVFNVGKRFATIKNYFPRGDIEPVKGTNAQARDYATKSDTRVSGPFEYGEFIEERGRSDIKDMFDLIKGGATNDELMNLCPANYLRYKNTIESIRQDALYEKMQAQGVRRVEVVYVYGPPGTGKTSSIYRKYKPNEFYRVTDYKKGPFDRYAGEDIIVFDEFASQLPFELFLHCLDSYVVQLPCRFTNKVSCWSKVYVISNIPWQKLYPQIHDEEPERFKAIERRLNVVLYFSKAGVQIISQKSSGIQMDVLETPPPDMPF